ncbi:hypothetical protein BOW35_05165 [Solemya velum gill symbiont]|uniref:vWA domain-containing protein n=1 Tax=Solemya velum gill symbiont TaxID=2340 RepID=UPI000996F544|nr:VWA-like domain-containing protein [Solemya velum gill symbiont]OOZ15319.1 hypothetical protein BOW27_04730 [Solemya velum gill symbiont]OOZ19237.1 hypothetical protein BOW29_08020 [Solemya velum gill symbiont]OOZ21683.1 hypothetical protein BOW30_08625 [Solemya velum gill symbiont]OOZ24861.1 hypothetical protein BOW31_04460 [Solemya velum gill symbiont]OOZ29696.1 hypothetical protein BOW33_04320 [Solemya velum gill symbiont]
MLDAQAVETKLVAARTRLIIDKPFLGALVLRLPLKTANASWCPTAATDAKHFYYNAEYIDNLSIEQTQFILAHEALHCALRHFARRGHRVIHRWDLACDLAINPLLMTDGLTPPPEALYIPQYEGMTAEEIYPLLEEDDDRETMDQHLYDSSENDSGGDPDGEGMDSPPPPSQRQQQQQNGGKQHERDDNEAGGSTPSGMDDRPQGAPGDSADTPPPPLTEQEKETLDVQWQQRTAGAAQQALQAGKLGGVLARMIDHLLQPQLPWRNLLARYMSMLARDDFSYMRPSRREGDAILPSLRSAQVDLVVAIDTSGSLKAKEIAEFISEIDALKGQVRARLTLLPCDATIAEGAPWEYEPWEEFKLPEKIHGGGGTDFRPVFNWLEERGRQPDLLLYFTDADGDFPSLPPAYPVIWLVKNKIPVPWGERIQLN